ncbi:ubiquinone biosynthesis O-methyltransferase, mitochondrial-like [Pogonomyrmex barbatus]|uniref:Ubiquinone biosynthesis O-methyltransferase, mitochondrial n=1 Tax=Pogonomyrmex barbatus TaxID=144034 RepID=A0A6I9WKE1_9HYME|nr:ubiquinone biosynthesis O-methyltransferase, mitochondrial-like [Pogonomyrmex barbatus]XP_011641962.1 ubiquinone biosynthesis O-methyltransferase, mitochondrial-like [Pogonomyrmex barbatus]
MKALSILKYTNKSWSILQNRSKDIMCINRIVRPMSTVDSKELERFSSWDKTLWWNLNGPIHFLHFYNPFRIQFIKNGLINAGFIVQNPDLPLEGIKIVDVGCGGGILSESLARIGAQVTGIDVEPKAIDAAKQHAKLDPDILKRVNYIQTTVEEFSQEQKETYDAVVTSEVVEHVADPELFLKECVKMVKPGKSIFITTINRTLTSWLSTIIITEYIMNRIPRGTHEWNKFITPHEVERILENYGCKTISTRGIKYNSLLKKFAWSSSTSTFYLLHAIKQKN